MDEQAITIRPATLGDALGIAKVHIDTWRSTYQGIVPATYLDRMSYEDRERRWIQILQEAETEGKAAHFVFVAEDEPGQIVGFVAGGYNRNEDPLYESELYAIYILEAYHGRGIGRRLTLTLIKKLVELGIKTMLLWVFETNPARRFYEALGGQVVRISSFEIEGVTLNEVAYGWLDIRTLLKE